MHAAFVSQIWRSAIATVRDAGRMGVSLFSETVLKMGDEIDGVGQAGRCEC
jgi:hypothetical protein